MLLTYQEYLNLGFNSVSEADFPRYEREARYYLEYITFNKVMKSQPNWIQDKVKYAMCLVIDLLYEYNEKLKSIQKSDKEIIASGLKSESIKSHSVSFRDVTSDSQKELLKATEDVIYSIIRRVLLPTGLLYRGL